MDKLLKYYLVIKILAVFTFEVFFPQQQNIKWYLSRCSISGSMVIAKWLRGHLHSLGIGLDFIFFFFRVSKKWKSSQQNAFFPLLAESMESYPMSLEKFGLNF